MIYNIKGNKIIKMYFNFKWAYLMEMLTNSQMLKKNVTINLTFIKKIKK